jgi:hypothetical protein
MKQRRYGAGVDYTSSSDVSDRTHDKKASDEIKQLIKDFGEENIKRYDERGELIK